MPKSLIPKYLIITGEEYKSNDVENILIEIVENNIMVLHHKKTEFGLKKIKNFQKLISLHSTYLPSMA